MMARIVDVGTEFWQRLANRDDHQGDGKHNAIEFRTKYLAELDRQDAWPSKVTPFICLDFRNVSVLAPSFANEAFAYFTKYARPKDILEAIEFRGLSAVKQEIIEIELKSGYDTK